MPWGTEGYVVEPASEFLSFFDAEGAVVGPPSCPEEGDGCGDKLQRGIDG